MLLGWTQSCAHAAGLPEDKIAATAVESNTRDTQVYRFSVTNGGTLHLEMDRGNVTVVRGARRGLEIIVRRTVDGGSAEDVEMLMQRHRTETEVSGNDVHVTTRLDESVERGLRVRRRTSLRVDMEIRLPETYNVELSLGAGNLRITDVQGEMRTRLGAGTVDVAEVAGNVSVTSGSGNVSVGSVRGEATVDVGAGNVTVRHVLGRLSVRTGAGNIRAIFDRQPPHPATLASGAGNVVAEVRQGIGFRVSGAAAMGSATTDFGLPVERRLVARSFEGPIHGGGPDLTLRAGMGMVRLVRH